MDEEEEGKGDEMRWRRDGGGLDTWI